MKPRLTRLVALSVAALSSGSLVACGGSGGGSTGSNSACTGAASSPKPESQVVLAGSAPGMRRGAVIQGAAPLLFLVLATLRWAT